MKYLAGSLCFLFFLIGCRDNPQELFSITNEAEFTVPAGLDNINTHIFVINNLPSTLDAGAAQNGFSLEQIARVNSSTAEIRGTFEMPNYSNVLRVAVNLIDPTGEFPKREIYFQEAIQINHEGPLQLFGSLSDVKDLLSKETHSIEIELTFRSPTTQTLENRFIYNFVAFDNE